MKIKLLCVGKPRKQSPCEKLAGEYDRRVNRYVPFEERWVSPVSGRGESGRIRELEGRAVLEKLGEKEYHICLDSRGKQRSSEGMARWLAGHQNRSERVLTFILGGEEGLSPTVIKHADESFSLSSMTLPHELCRVVFLEQLYRALAILHGHPYHRS